MKRYSKAQSLEPSGTSRRPGRTEADESLALWLTLMDQERVLIYPAGQLIQVTNEPQTHLLVIVSGLAKLRAAPENGSEEVLRLLGPGDCDSLGFLTGKEHRWRDVMSLTTTALLRLSSTVLEQLLERQPLLYRCLLAQLHDQLEAQATRVLQRRLTARERVQALLEELADKAAPAITAEPARAVPNLSLAELGAISGLARETVSRSLSQLQRREAIRKTSDGWELLGDGPAPEQGTPPSPLRMAIAEISARSRHSTRGQPE